MRQDQIFLVMLGLATTDAYEARSVRKHSVSGIIGASGNIDVADSTIDATPERSQIFSRIVAADGSIGVSDSSIDSTQKGSPNIPRSIPERSVRNFRGAFKTFDEEEDIFNADEWSPRDSFRQENKASGKEVRQAVTGDIPTGHIKIGTPPKDMYAIFDTGSDKLVAKTWYSVGKLLDLVDAGVRSLTMPASGIYSHNTSSSFEPVFEEATDKNDVFGEKKVKVRSQGAIYYGSGDAITLLGKDTVNVGGISLAGFGLAEIQTDTLDILHQRDGTSAILGLQHMLDKTQGSSLFTRLREEGKMHAFGYCRESGNNGTFIWNDHSTEGYPVPVIGKIHWAVKMNSMKHELPDLSNSDLVDMGTDPAPAFSVLEESSSSKVIKRPGGKGSSTMGPGSPFSEVHRRQEDISKWVEQIKKRIKPLGRRSKSRPPSSHAVEKTIDRLSDNTESNSSSESSSEESGYDDWSSSDAESNSSSSASSSDNGCSNSSTSNSSASSSDNGGPDNSIDDIWDIFGYPETPAPPPQPDDLCSIENDRHCVAVIDTGTNTIAGPSLAIDALTKRVNIRTDCGNLLTAPNLKIQLGNVQLTIPPSAYVMKVEMPDYGFGYYGRASSANESESRPEVAQLYAKDVVDRLEHLGGLSVGLAEPGIHRDVDGAPSVKRLSRAAVWRKVFADLHRKKGIDLRHHLAGISDAALSGETICLPALSVLDANTQYGKLWILGTPVYEKYYTRWEWPEEDESPTISFLANSISKTCSGSDVKNDEEGDEKVGNVNLTGLNADTALKKKTIESSVDNERPKQEHGHVGSLLQTSATGPQASYRHVKLEDIRYPHWARGLTQI